jgi:hypothetical protein
MIERDNRSRIRQLLVSDCRESGGGLVGPQLGDVLEWCSIVSVAAMNECSECMCLEGMKCKCILDQYT